MKVTQVQAVSEEEYTEKIKIVYPQAEEELIDFLNRCLKNYVPYANNKAKWPSKRPNQSKWSNQGPNKGKAVAQVPSIHQRTQWRRFQRQKKLANQNAQTGGNANSVKIVEVAKRPAKERISSNDLSKIKEVEDEYMDDDLLKSESGFDVICNVVSILPREYDVWSEITDREEEFEEPELAD
ncbi:hypothetical protein A2U01_0026407, partial [Trifolium medium]|nr:hypothetical protein [Trifolium medium]